MVTSLSWIQLFAKKVNMLLSRFGQKSSETCGELMIRDLFLSLHTNESEVKFVEHFMDE